MTELKLLAIETSSPTASIALAVGDAVSETTIATPREQTPRILAIIDSLLSDAGLRLGDLDALVYGRGPGSFTGLRVAAAVAQGLSFSSGVPIVSVSSLAALAQRGLGGHDAKQDSRSADPATTQALCCVDARMGEVYWASFSRADGIVHAESEERIGSPGSVEAPQVPFVAIGDGFSAYAEALTSVLGAADSSDSTSVPGARELLLLGAAQAEAGQFVPLETALPVYLRGANAWRKS